MPVIAHDTEEASADREAYVGRSVTGNMIVVFVYSPSSGDGAGTVDQVKSRLCEHAARAAAAAAPAAAPSSPSAQSLPLPAATSRACGSVPRHWFGARLPLRSSTNMGLRLQPATHAYAGGACVQQPASVRPPQPVAPQVPSAQPTPAPTAQPTVPSMPLPHGCVVVEVHHTYMQRYSRVLSTQMQWEESQHQELYLTELHPPSANCLMPVRVLVVGMETPQMLDAAGSLVRMIYSYDVCTELQHEPVALVHVCGLADQLQAKACVETCGQAFDAVQPADISPADISRLACAAASALGENVPELKAAATRCMEHLLSTLLPPADSQPNPHQITAAKRMQQLQALAGLPPDQLHLDIAMRVLEQGTSLAQLHALSLERLMITYGDANHVLNSPQLLDTFCTFPQRVLRAWLGSDELLCARSEGTVLRLLMEWYAAQRATLTDAAAWSELDLFMGSLAALVRVPFLPPCFITYLLSGSFHWLGPKEHVLLLCSMISNKMDMSLLDKETAGQVPAAWLSTKPRPPSPTAARYDTISISVSEQQHRRPG